MSISHFDPKRTSGRHPNKPFQSGIVSLSAGWVGRMRRCEFLGVLGGAAATLAVCTTVLNAADEKAFEKALLGHIMWSAFQCSTYAELSDYKSEQERLHLVGLNAGRTFLEAMKAGQISEQALSSTLANFVAGWIRLFCKHFRCRLEFSYGLGCARDRNKSSVLHILGHSAYPPFRKLAKVELRMTDYKNHHQRHLRSHP